MLLNGTCVFVACFIDKTSIFCMKNYDVCLLTLKLIFIGVSFKQKWHIHDWLIEFRSLIIIHS